jgi:NAD(P)-dependent dehydrogenase (short-subunit alcohol dehydrogenase family)
MAKLRHPLTGGIYELQPDGRVHVEENGAAGVFEPEGRWRSGALRHADPHLIGWVAFPRPKRVASAAAGAPPRASAPAREGRKGMDLGLEGRKALVTGASRGIGLAIARQLADEGADVAICARGEAGLEAARKDLEARGVRVFVRALDLADGGELADFVRGAGESLGGLDVVVCNASAGAGRGEDAWRANFEIDVLGSTRVVDAALPLLAGSDAASVVFIGSTAALEYLGVPQPYNALKAALIAHANDLSQALAPQGVRVNVVSPGPIYFEGGSWQMIERMMPQIYERALAQCAIGRMGAPEEVARAVVFLSSPAASLVTGANLVVDGGFTKRVAW